MQLECTTNNYLQMEQPHLKVNQPGQIVNGLVPFVICMHATEERLCITFV